MSTHKKWLTDKEDHDIVYLIPQKVVSLMGFVIPSEASEWQKRYSQDDREVAGYE